MRTALATLSMVAALTLVASATDHLVDATGVQSPLRNLTQAMAVAVPGDRILVLPGNYPAFHFSRGVEVIGLGSGPRQVVIARVDFHPTAPTNNFDAALSNVTICSADPADSTSISGNELAQGTLVLDGVVTCGGVYLHGAGQFYLMVVDSRIEPQPGDGFLGTAFDFGGGIADFVDSWVAGSDASAITGDLAGVGLKVGGGSTVRLSNSHVLGGDGAAGVSTTLHNGADAIRRGLGAALPTLRLSGGSIVSGGNAASSGLGGAGVNMIAAIQVGHAVVVGGSGTPPGLAWPASQPTQMARDPYLTMDSAKVFAGGDTFFRTPVQIVVQPGEALSGISIGYGQSIDWPSSATGSPLTPSTTVFDNSGQHVFDVNRNVTTVTRRIYVQGFFQESRSGPIIATNPIAVTIAPN